MTRDEFITTITPALYSFLGVAIPAFLGWMGTIAAAWGSRRKQKFHQDNLHRALETGTAAAKTILGPEALPAPIAEYAVTYAQQSVPDAFEVLKPPREVLLTLAYAKQQENKP